MNRGEEDYIKAIYEIESRQQSHDVISNLHLMQYFSHTAQTVNEMIKKLSKKKLVEYIPYKGSTLTEDGRNSAIRLTRVHRIWETFLVEKLGYSWEEVHDEAERLEHITTKKMEERLFIFLGEPETCPHGNKIPSVEYHKEIKEIKKNTLIDAIEKKEYRLESVVDDKEILTYLNHLDVKIGQLFSVSRIDPVNELIELSMNNQTIVIGYKVAKCLFVNAC
ncbi:metal-dependent transcriptional regulator [Petrocella sp. FN5]|uniref:metal-dependent transcriptional regulator n=1 Tax=Petrocella sp. FN5 TaxID=3032002 RepID=UPI0023D9F26A|nr:metal-dependent transcriptional regulator [Petrocella sp. FN5]MDF1618311.1 metal-dependent transcriptional regulator [Petrocella sp. FN5]